jgi:tRNA 2-selenouridine synthase
LNSQDLDLSQFGKLFLSARPLIDVRAPIEFALGHLPGAVNLPLLNDDERAAIGTTFKNKGQEAAIALGHQLVSGDVKENRIRTWLDCIDQNPSAVFYCFRGGLRSQITREWIRERGVERPLIIGGYKAARNFLIAEMDRVVEANRFLVVAGPTGSGKTLFIEEARSFFPLLNLELLANHRGSAFGGLDKLQPSQINFENELALALMKVESTKQNERPLLIEDESRMIGRCTVPAKLHERILSSDFILIEENLDARVENIFKEYVVDAKGPNIFDRYKRALHAISKRLGGVRAKEILLLLENAEKSFLLKLESTKNQLEWIEKLLVYYYDPLYSSSLKRREGKCLFKGTRLEALAFLQGH